MSRVSLAPLRHPDPAVRAALAARLAPFRRSGALGSLAVHVVDHLAAMADERDVDVLLALALAVRAPAHGHICVDLAEIQAKDLLPDRPDDHKGEIAAAQETLLLPGKRPEWLERVGKSDMVRDGAPFVLHDGLLYSERYFSHQRRLAEDLAERVKLLRPPGDPGLLRQGLAAFFGPPSADGQLDRQRLAAAMALLRGLTVISGGPGTGKTRTVRNILGLLWAQWAVGRPAELSVAGPTVALAAPTGKAAQRMKESLRKDLEPFLASAEAALPAGRKVSELRAFLDQLVPSTLHRLLGPDPARPTRFRHHRGHPLPVDIVIVDEASMIDFALMARLVEAVDPAARLILLGDKHQLASVEAGTVLADICGPIRVEGLQVSAPFAEQLQTLAGVQVGESVAKVARAGPQDAIVQLNKGYRFKPDSGIGRFASACLAEPFDPTAAVAVLAEPGGDVQLHKHGPRGELLEEVCKTIVDGYTPYLEALFAGPVANESQAAFHSRVLAEFERFRVLCAHRNGRLGVSGMNKRVVELLTAAKRQRRGLARLSARGDYWPGQPILIRRNDYVVGRFNGDIGIVVRREGKLSVAFPADGPEPVQYLPPLRLPEHQTVFAMTIHKSQGSEFNHALVMLPEADSLIMTRELIYTGVTRAAQKMTLVGDQQRVSEALQRPVQRASGLSAMLWGGD